MNFWSKRQQCRISTVSFAGQVEASDQQRWLGGRAGGDKLSALTSQPRSGAIAVLSAEPCPPAVPNPARNLLVKEVQTEPRKSRRAPVTLRKLHGGPPLASHGVPRGPTAERRFGNVGFDFFGGARGRMNSIFLVRSPKMTEERSVFYWSWAQCLCRLSACQAREHHSGGIVIIMRL